MTASAGIEPRIFIFQLKVFIARTMLCNPVPIYLTQMYTKRPIETSRTLFSTNVVGGAACAGEPRGCHAARGAAGSQRLQGPWPPPSGGQKSNFEHSC